jgi:hypothetical protein
LPAFDLINLFLGLFECSLKGFEGGTDLTLSVTEVIDFFSQGIKLFALPLLRCPYSLLASR